MRKARTQTTNKRKLVGLTIEPKHVMAIDRWRNQQPVPPSRSATIATACAEFVAKHTK
jgi:regulator of PEP synthase PpsR (kinase-PPPase family)